MPAASLTVLFDFETQIESAIETALTAAGVTATKQRDADDKAAPLVSIQFTQGESLGSLFKHDGVYREDRFEGEVVLTIATYRNATSDSHPTYRAKVRTVMSDWQTDINGELDHLILLDCKTAGASPEVSQEDDYDISALRYRTPFAIRSTAWPV